MTNAEAIENLRYLISGECCDTQMDYVEEIEMAISALEKQEQKKPLTNADRIRAMTDEELALYLVWTSDPDTLTVDYRVYECHDRSVKDALDWLKQEATDGSQKD